MIGVLLAQTVNTIVLVVVTMAAAVGSLAGLVPAMPPLVVTEVGGGMAERGGQELDALITGLRSSDAHDRAMAACRIGRMRRTDVSAARDALIGLLGDGAPVESRLCRERDNWSDERQSSPGREAAIALERVGPSAIDPLIAVLEGNDGLAREHAAFALGLIEDERAVGPLSAALRDEIVGVRSRAAWGLGMIESAAAVPSLAEALRDSAARVREQAAWALGMIEDSSGVDDLVGALRDEDADVREQAAWALGMIEDSGGVAGLLDALRDEDADVREQAAWALGMIEDGRAVEGLIAAVEDADAGVRKQALWALMQCIDEIDDVDYEKLAETLRRVLRGGGAG